MKRISLLGIAIGAIVDLVATFILILPLLIYMMIALISTGTPPDKVGTAVDEALYANALYLSASLLLGGLGTVLGGYVSARIAKHDEVLNGALSSILYLGFSAYVVITGAAGDRLWLNLIFFPLTPALAAFGGYLRARQNARRNAT